MNLVDRFLTFNTFSSTEFNQKILPVENQSFYAAREKDGLTEAAKVLVAFRKCFTIARAIIFERNVNKRF